MSPVCAYRFGQRPHPEVDRHQEHTEEEPHVTITTAVTSVGLDAHGIAPAGRVFWNPTTAQLYTEALRRGDGALAHGGPLVVDTGKHTGRSPKDKFVVREPGSEGRIWWGDVNQPLEEDRFDRLRGKVVAHLESQHILYVVDHFAGADPAHRIGVRVVTASPYHALFAKTMFIVPRPDEMPSFTPDALRATAREAMRRKSGARGLRAILEQSMLDIMYDVPFREGVKECVITEGVVRGREPPMLSFEKEKKLA